jgi:hypothetical protein
MYVKVTDKNKSEWKRQIKKSIEVFVPVHGLDDTVYFKVSKTEAIKILEKSWTCGYELRKNNECEIFIEAISRFQ